MKVTEYAREFVRLSKYAWEYVSTEAIMCKRFEDGLNEDIRFLVGMLKLKEFVVLVKRVCEAEELAKEKQKANLVSRDLKKRQLSKSFQSSSKKSREFTTRSKTSAGYLSKNRKESGSGTRSKGAPRESAVRPEGKAPARTYSIRAREEALSPDVITGSTHSYICMKLVSGMNLFVEPTKFRVKVSNPLGKGHYFPANLMLLPFDKFDVILGMDWLTTHDVVEPDELNGMPAVISSVSAKRCIRKGYEAYLTFVLNTKESELKIESIPVVCEYSDVFLKEFIGLPPIKEVEFGIDLTLGPAPISITLYRTAPTELKELKVQLQELTDKDFARPSFSP
ncbi:uncharacterized protein LOC108477480 [Gossypium arboreum]|uniref:uncharacterized protein LOC108477480 n=1 Tax=Gossypium arboreum TaxID=29729 RepID=UPI0022F15ECA|nr:uncharacterized protein LOC108477480 [Gossypium arboreum]